MQKFKILALFKDKDYNYDFRAKADFTLTELADEDIYYEKITKLIDELLDYRLEILDELEGEEFGEVEEDGRAEDEDS